MFTDRVRIKFSAGKGGNGVVAWRREKYIPKGGPYGGNGGDGGSIIIKADPQILSLDAFRNRRQQKAENGGQGGTNKKRGKNGQDLVIRVPCGTLVKEADTDIVLADLVVKDQQIQLCQGGRGGRGNATFKSSTHRAPNTCTPGKLGEEKAIELELKLIAQVGLVGFPNAGKSTLIGSFTRARPKVAAYPFTTLAPNIGYLQLEDYTMLSIADIPGIIEGAHQNRGLGIEFLRHIERTKLLVFVLDASGIDGRCPDQDWQVLRRELAEYNQELLDRPFLIVLNKCDTEESKQHIADFYEKISPPKNKTFVASAKTGEGLDELLQVISEEGKVAVEC